MRDYNASSAFFISDQLLIPQTATHHARAISNGEKPESPAGMVKPKSWDVWWFVEGGVY
jgi:hypothetical protein